MQLNYLARNGKPGHKEAAIAEIQRRGVQVSMAPQAKTDAIAPAGKVNSDKPATNSSPVPALNAGNSVNAPATTEQSSAVANAQATTPSIQRLQDQLDKTDPFSEESQSLTHALQSAVTDDARSAIDAGEMPVYKVTDHVSVAIHPSAQNPGMVQVTRYTKDGVIGDSQYNNIDEAVRYEGLTHKPRIAPDEAVAAIEKSIQAEAEYQARKAAPANQVPVKNEAPAAATVPAETVAPKQEPIKNEDDWLGALFGAAPTAAESASKEVQTNRQAQDKADRVDSAIAMLTGEIEASNAAAAEVAARNYKSNRKQIELKGDGPGKNGSLSISAINESRKRRTVEALQNASSSIKQAIEFIAENPDAAFKQVADMEAAVTKQFNEGFFGPSAKLDGQLDMAVGSLIGSGSYSGEGSAGRKLRMAAHAYAAVDAVSQPKTDAAPEAKRKSSQEWVDEGKTPDQLRADKVDSLAMGLAGQVAEEASQSDFDPSEMPAAVRAWSDDARVPADELRQALLKRLSGFDISKMRMAQIRRALDPTRNAAPVSTPKASRNKIDPEKDSLFVAIAKAGGMDTDELLSNGIDSNDITFESAARVKKDGQLSKKRRMPISFGFALPLHKKGGMSFDAMREAMQQYGYLPQDATKNDAIDLFQQELGGSPVYTAKAIEFQREQDQESFDKMMWEEQDRIDAELAALEIAEDDSGYNELSDEAQSLADDFAEIAFGENGKQDEHAIRAGMRALGFTEKEINDELAKNSQAQRESEEIAAGPGQESGAGRDRNRAEDAQARERDGEEGFGLAGQTNREAAAEFKRQQEEEAKKDEAQASPTVKADQVDLFNTQDSLFNSNRDAAPVAKAAEQSPAVDAKKQEEAKPVAGPTQADEKPADSKATADAGEELTYNKRNRRTGGLKWDDIKDKNAALRVKEVVKAKVYPKPDYQALVDGGMRDVVAHIVKQAYDAIAPAPKMKRGAEVSDAALQSYIAGVNRVMDGVTKWANDGAAVAKWASAQSKLSGGSFSISELATAESLLDTVYPGGWKASREEIIMIGGNKMLGALQPGHDEVGRAMKDIKLGWPAKSEAWQKQGYKVVNAETVDVELYSSPQRDKRAAYVSGTVTANNQRIDSFIVRGTADKESQEVQDAIAEKRKQLEGNYVLVDKVGRIEGVYADEEAAIEAAREKVKRESGEIKEVGRKVSEVGREGVEHRLPGDDVTTERLKETFGFRGVNFGNWMKGETNAKTAERQLHLNHLFDAFMDLAQLLNVPPKAMSLNGMLGIAVGAQGSGKAWAHFVPGVNEINVTRTNGAGALAHEWGHALDHYFATMGGMDRNNEPYLSAHVGTLTNRVENGKYVRSPVDLADVRPEVAAQFQSIVEAMTKRKETDAEYAERIRRDVDIAGRMVADEIKKITDGIDKAKDGWGTPAFAAKIRGLAERVATLDYGDGRVSIGSSEVPAVVAEIADAYKAASGIPMKNADMLGYYADHYRVMSGILESEEGRSPREVNTDYKKASDAADFKKKPYWSTKLEMFARAFDAYVVDSLAEKAASNTYLAGIEAVAPQGDERKSIGKSFDFLFAELKTKETDKGIALYNIASQGSISAADKAIYGMASEGKSAAEILKFIASASRNPMNRQLAKLLLKTGIAPSITVGDGKGWKMNAGEGHKYAAAYNPKTDTVALFRPASAERHVLHELIHAATLRALGKKSLASAQMKALFAHVQKNGRSAGLFYDAKTGAGIYGMANVDEFVAEVFSNPKFQQMLKQVSAPQRNDKPSSAWDWFVRVVRGILGVPQGQENALSRAIELGVGVMREDMKIRRSEAGVQFSEIAGDEIEKALGRTIQEKARNWMKARLQGKSFQNDATGWDISVGRKGIGKVMMHAAKDVHSRSVVAIPDLIKNAVLVASEANRNTKERDDVPMVHHFYAPLRVGGSEYVARLVVKETRSGQRFYDFDTSDEIGPAVLGETHTLSQTRGAAPSARLDMSMAELLSYVKAEHGGTDPKFIRYATGPKQTDSAAFRKWFGDSKVVDADGKPLVVYHGTGATDISDFKVSKRGTYGGGIYLTPDIRGANDYAIYRGAPSSTVYPVYAAIKNPASGAEASQVASWKGEENAREELIRRGYDGVVDMRSGEIVAFYPSQVKSAIGNNGDFDAGNPDIRYNVADEGEQAPAITRIVGDSGREYDQRQREFFKNVGREITPKSMVDRTLDYLKNDFWKKMAVGIVDQFRGLRDLGDNGQAYMLARLSKGTAGAFETLLHHGKLSIKDGVYDGDQSGGFVERLGVPLHGELDDFLWYVAANRAEGLAKHERENLFTPEDIAAGKSLASGNTAFDYTIQTGPAKGKVTRSRAVIYGDALRVFNEFQKNALDIAEQSGLIDGAARKFWESEFYVPFYRVSEEDGEFIGAKMGKSLVRQQAFKKLKGGTDKLNSDLLSNTLLNWSHLIEASAKNRAAKASLVAAEQVGAAHKAMPGEKKTVWFMDNGQKAEYGVDDPFVMTAITSLEYAGMRNGIMDVMTKFKHWLTIGVTASPAFKVRNLIRDSIQAIGASGLSYNAAGNIKEGWGITGGSTATKNMLRTAVGMSAEQRKLGQEYVSALASGGLIRFGTMIEGSESSRVRQLIKSGVKDSTIIDSEAKWRQLYDRYLEPAISAYNELGNVSEEVNRAALYNQLIKQGKSHAEAALMARDLMDFSMQGSFNTIRFLTQVVPFMNARLQGMYKLGRSAKDNQRKLAVVTGAVALASIALMLGYDDDDDWKRREDWDRDNFWWFKLGGLEWRIPKPFEVGAVGTLAERSVEYLLNDEMTGERFRKVVGSLVSNNLSMNPIPQVFKPVLDLYANKDSFTGRPIESMGMQRLDPTMRYNSNTSMVARGLSAATGGIASPVQYDHLARAYFGWLGSFVVGGSEMAARSISDEPTKPALDYWKFATQGIVREEGTGSSRYVTMVYEQAKELEQAHATYRRLLKDGKIEEATGYAADHQDELRRYRQVEAVKRVESQFNERIHAIERSDISSEEKKVRIERINKMKESAAKRLAPGA